jgi:DNA-binding transcriptional regulator YdaS (Cro superfamily)
METGISKAIRLAGSQTALGSMLRLTPQAIQKWEAKGVVPGDRCREVETKLNGQVTRYELNPTVFGEDPALNDAGRRNSDDRDLPGDSYGRRKDDCSATTSP